MRTLKQLFENNRQWAERLRQDDPTFFERLSMDQSPGYLWIGCSDSRAPASQIVGLLPGELFVHRNIANVVLHTDLNCLSVLQYAVEVLKVRHVIVCGHYDCGGIRAYLSGQRQGLIDNWLRAIHTIYIKHQSLLNAIVDPRQRLETLCELNIVEQVWNISQTTIVQDAWQRKQSLSIHGWIYRLSDGLLQDMGIHMSGDQDVATLYQTSIAVLHKKNHALANTSQQAQ
jgi:carbonic anhydrase